MAPAYEVKAKDRIRKGLAKYSAILREKAQRGINEEDTSVIVRDMLAELLGYERFREISAQFKVKGHFVDWAVSIGEDLRFFVEVKALGARLGDRDLFQITSYTHQKPDLDWAVLTTAEVWQCHRVAAKSDTEQFFEVRLLEPSQSEDEKVDWLYLLSREAMSRDLMQTAWERAECYRPEGLARVLLSEEGLAAIRRVVRKEHPGRRVEAADLRDALVRGVIRGDVYAQMVETEGKTSAGGGAGAEARTKNMFASLISQGKLKQGEEVYDPEGRAVVGTVRDGYIERTDGTGAVNMRQLTGASSFAAAAVMREGVLVRFDKLRRG